MQNGPFQIFNVYYMTELRSLMHSCVHHFNGAAGKGGADTLFIFITTLFTAGQLLNFLPGINKVLS